MERLTWEIESRRERWKIWDGEPADEHMNNDVFKVPVFVPDKFFKKKRAKKHFLIMTHGMGEIIDSIYTGEGENRFCRAFAKEGIASVFLPLPFHFNRLSLTDQKLLDEAIKRKMENPDSPLDHPAVCKILRHSERFYLGYEQLWWDIQTVADKIQHFAESNGLLKDNLLISLWGYSIGGLPIVGRLLFNPDAFHSCILLHSGANLENLGLMKHLFKPEQWDEIRKDYREKKFLTQISGGTDRWVLKTFNMLFLGEEPDKLFDFFCNLSCKILILVGSEDDIESLNGIVTSFPRKKIENSEKTGWLPLHILPGLTHQLNNKDFLKWFNYEYNMMNVFIKHHPPGMG